MRLIDQSNDGGKSTFNYSYRHFDDLAHERGISSLTAAKHSQNSLRLITGGIDRRLYLWDFIREGREFRCYVGKSSLHNKHTSAIQSVLYNTVTDKLYSGGLDWYVGAVFTCIFSLPVALFRILSANNTSF
jgi:hypothetical protein